MPSGTLEVFLVNAKGLEDQNWLTSMNPYVILTCRTQEKESGVASGEGTDPEWNETFVFTISSDVEEITLRIMDKDTLSSDDFVGEATIPLHEVLREGEVSERAYNVVKDEDYCGEIKLSLTFTSESGSHRGNHEEEYGGRRKSRHDSRGSDEEEYGGGRRKSRNDSGGSDEEEYGGRRKSRNDSGGSDEEEYGRRRRSSDRRRGSDEDNYGGYRESRDDY
ncbi:elicitor-responsive protein 3-like isoform X1 [Solanum verrucosum]|uniref:elicitor-responsive protein 3-like isoform X1 n=1 Tax=Solanum verrucosum TaxID=315347 RepID=UPI0020D15CC2|nr:elicitor-responsive protein 3-like isoform X1 [Solanum verrucosum]